MNQASKEEIRSLYLSGLSGGQIVERTGWSSTHVYRQLRDITRTQSETKALMWPDSVVHPNSARHRARIKMEARLGYKLDSNQTVHHVNEDPHDNRIENLEVLSRGDHTRLHHPKDPIPRHKRANRIAWRKKYLPTRTISAQCAICKTPFRANKYRPGKTCSRPCRGKLSYNNAQQTTNL